MAWLIRDAEVLAALEPHRRGWRRELRGAMVLPRVLAVQTFSVPVALDVAWCSPVRPVRPPANLQVVRVVMLDSRRLAMCRPGSSAAVVGPAGAFERWGLKVGDCLEIKGG